MHSPTPRHHPAFPNVDLNRVSWFNMSWNEEPLATKAVQRLITNGSSSDTFGLWHRAHGRYYTFKELMEQ